jgi:hypothetical protein
MRLCEAAIAGATLVAVTNGLTSKAALAAAVVALLDGFSAELQQDPATGQLVVQLRIPLAHEGPRITLEDGVVPPPAPGTRARARSND